MASFTIDGHQTITVGELIEKLQQFDPNAGVEIMMRQYNKSYPIGYFGVEDAIAGPFQNVRLESSLPNNMRTMVLKQA